MLEVKAVELELVKEFMGYHLARYQGNLGIWSISEEIDWDATFAAESGLIKTGEMVGMLMDDDCNHLLNPEAEGLFECRVMDLKAEGDYLASFGA